MAEHNAVVGIYTTHTEAEAAVKALQRSGFDMQQLSIVGKDYHTEEHVIGYYTTGDRMQVWGKRGAFWGGLWGLLVGSGFFFIPGIGPLLVFGPLVSWIIGALEGAVVGGGLSALGAGLYSLGIPKDSIVEYETALKSDQFLVMAYGTRDEVAQAQRLLEAAGAAQVAAYQATIPRETLAQHAFMHGNTCLAAGQFADAIAAFHQAQKLNPKHPYVAARLAEVARRQQAAGATPPVTPPL
jgi:Heat induced stress protein YflT domain